MTLALATSWLWYQSALYPLSVVRGPIDGKQVQSLLKPPLAPLYILLALVGVYSLVRTRRSLVQRGALACLIAVYLWMLAGRLGLRARPTCVPVVLISLSHRREALCGLLIQQSGISEQVWHAEGKTGYITSVPRRDVQDMRYGPSVELLSVAAAAAESDDEFPNCAALGREERTQSANIVNPESALAVLSQYK